MAKTWNPPMPDGSPPPPPAPPPPRGRIEAWGLALTVAAAVAAFVCHQLVLFVGAWCGEVTFENRVAVKGGLLLVAVAFAAVPFAVGQTLRRAGHAPTGWFVVAGTVLVAGAIHAATTEPIMWCLF